MLAVLVYTRFGPRISGAHQKKWYAPLVVVCKSVKEGKGDFSSMGTSVAYVI